MILLVDDQKDVAGTIREVLQHWGYDVEWVENGRLAMEFLNKHAGQVKLLLSDQRMPEVSGIDLVKHLQRHFSGIPAILMSGTPFPPEAHALRVPLVNKPPQFDFLKNLIRQLISPPSGREMILA